MRERVTFRNNKSWTTVSRPHPRDQTVKSTYIAAFLVAALFILWLLSGQLDGDESQGPAPSLAQSREALLAMQEDEPTRVRARTVRAETQSADVVVRGRTEADRSVDVRTEVAGRITELPVDKGDRVVEGDLLCRIAEDARPARVEEAREVVRQARLENEGAQRLGEKGYQSETAIASSSARLAAALAELRQRELDLANTAVRAPFDGVIEERPAEIGNLLQAGSICARVVDPDPMMLVGQVAERDIGRIRSGDPGQGLLITGQAVEGTVAFVARTADPATRTFRVEVAVDNADATLRDGITTEIRLPVERYAAHRVPSALLALDDAGDLGIRILDQDNVVRFVNVEILKDTPSGLWVRGLPDPATIITVGQELVTPGEIVEPTFEAGTSMPASVEPSAPPSAPDDDNGADSPSGELGAASLAQPSARTMTHLPRASAAGPAA